MRTEEDVSSHGDEGGRGGGGGEAGRGDGAPALWIWGRGGMAAEKWLDLFQANFHGVFTVDERREATWWGPDRLGSRARSTRDRSRVNPVLF